VAKWFILSLIFVFDPLAIALILAYNVVVYRKEDERVYDTPSVEESTNSKEPEKLEIVDLPEEKKKTQLIVPSTTTTTTSTTTLTTTNTTPPPEIPMVKEEPMVYSTTEAVPFPPVVIETPKPQEVVNVPVEIPSNKVTNPPNENYGDNFFRGMFKK
jgi:hypothetical protein